MQLLVDTAVALLLFAILCILIGKTTRDRIAIAIAKNAPGSFWTVAIIVLVVCATPLLSKYGFGYPKLLPLALYFCTPALILTMKQRWKLGYTADLCMAFAIFIPAVYRWIPAWTNTAIRPSIPIAYWGMTIYLLATLPAASDIRVDSQWRFNRADLKLVLALIPILLVSIVPLAIHAHFLVPGMRWFSHHGVWEIPLIFAAIFFMTAIPEEVLCRLAIQGILSKKYGGAWGIFVAAIVFGCGHITREVKNSLGNFSYPNWWYVLFAVIAGIGYGYVYHKRRSLVACAVLHACVDLTWSIFFRN